MIIFDQHCIVQAEAMIASASAATAYLSSARRPGVVLRVSAMLARVPATRSTRVRVAVAMPDSRPSRFSAVRSPVRIARARCAISPPRWRPAPTRSPSPTRADVSSRSVVEQAKCEHRDRQCRRRFRRRRATMRAQAALRFGLDDCVGRKVAAAADVFEQCGSNDRLGDQLKRRLRSRVKERFAKASSVCGIVASIVAAAALAAR